MDGHMKINGETVRALREKKSWSQEHLANASGVSERTIQRVEVDGVGSAETRLALAAALGVTVSELLADSWTPSRAFDVVRRIPVWGWIGYGIALACCAAFPYVFRQNPPPFEQITISLLPWLALFGISAGVIGVRTALRRR